MHVTTFDIENLASTCKFFRSILNSKEFGTRYLQKEQQHLTADINIEEQISQLHTFAISLISNTKILVILNSRMETKIIHIDISLSGRPTFWETITTLKCNLLDMNNAKHSFKGCQFCSRFNIKTFKHLVDKQYRVFFRTWQDNLSARNEAGVTFNICIQHHERGIDWDPVPLLPRIETNRYGIRINAYDYCYLETLFKMDKLTIQTETSPILELTPRGQVYNPWAS